MTQTLFWPSPPDVAVPRWLCPYQACAAKGRAVYDAPVDAGRTLETRVRCLTCGRWGWESARKDLL